MIRSKYELDDALNRITQLENAIRKHKNTPKPMPTPADTQLYQVLK